MIIIFIQINKIKIDKNRIKQTAICKKKETETETEKVVVIIIFLITKIQ